MFADRRVWLLCAIYFCYVMGHYGLTFWLPVLVQTAGVEGTARIGFVTAVPYIVAVVVMLLVGHSADRRRERRWHTAVADDRRRPRPDPQRRGRRATPLQQS